MNITNFGQLPVVYQMEATAGAQWCRDNAGIRSSSNYENLRSVWGQEALKIWNETNPNVNDSASNILRNLNNANTRGTIVVILNRLLSLRNTRTSFGDGMDQIFVVQGRPSLLNTSARHFEAWERQLQAKDQEIARLNQEIARLQAQAGSSSQDQQTIASLQSQINSLNQQIKDKDNQITNLQNQIADKDKQISDLKQDKDDLKKDKEELKRENDKLKEENKELKAQEQQCQADKDNLQSELNKTQALLTANQQRLENNGLGAIHDLESRVAVPSK